jgi:hypothetical protein
VLDAAVSKEPEENRVDVHVTFFSQVADDPL